MLITMRIFKYKNYQIFYFSFNDIDLLKLIMVNKYFQYLFSQFLSNKIFIGYFFKMRQIEYFVFILL